ncbi:MAG: hypothetical protein NWE95_02505 [Candidatus Bathyarchaeota archaeon]|nr:hypothetical protein [Candidatus Bathyarchaeota archaeon]
MAYKSDSTTATPQATPSPTVPEFPPIAIIALTLALLMTAVVMKQEKPGVKV